MGTQILFHDRGTHIQARCTRRGRINVLNFRDVILHSVTQLTLQTSPHHVLHTSPVTSRTASHLDANPASALFKSLWRFPGGDSQGAPGKGSQTSSSCSFFNLYPKEEVLPSFHVLIEWPEDLVRKWETWIGFPCLPGGFTAVVPQDRAALSTLCVIFWKKNVCFCP